MPLQLMRKRERRKPTAREFALLIGLCLVGAVFFGYQGAVRVRQIAPAERDARRYHAAPRCMGQPMPTCRAAVPGLIEREFRRRSGKNYHHQAFAVRFPNAIREVTMLRLREGRRNQMDPRYAAFQPGNAVTAEQWAGRVTALTVGEQTEPTWEHPDVVVAHHRERRDTMFSGAVVMLALAAVFAGLTRVPAHHWEQHSATKSGAAPQGTTRQ